MSSADSLWGRSGQEGATKREAQAAGLFREASAVGRACGTAALKLRSALEQKDTSIWKTMLGLLGCADILSLKASSQSPTGQPSDTESRLKPRTVFIFIWPWFFHF